MRIQPASAPAADAGFQPAVGEGIEQKVAAYLRGCLHRRLSLDDLASSCGLSKFHFVREFKAASGVTPYQYLLACRIDQACVLLRVRGEPLAAVARQCGFSHYNCFLVAFKRRTGMSPSAYRKRASE